MYLSAKYFQIKKKERGLGTLPRSQASRVSAI
jgi:hypothetical protein